MAVFAFLYDYLSIKMYVWFVFCHIFCIMKNTINENGKYDAKFPSQIAKIWEVKFKKKLY